MWQGYPKKFIRFTSRQTGKIRQHLQKRRVAKMVEPRQIKTSRNGGGY
jgi:hypothetical protein